MMWSDASRQGHPFAKDPSVIKFHGRYLLYYSLQPYAPARPDKPAGWAIGVAESRNLRDWKKIGEVLPEQAYEQGGVCAPGARVLGGKVHLFYQSYGHGQKNAICHAWSSDGVTFDRDPSNPVFHPTGAWTNGRAIDAEVVAWKGKLWLYCATRDPSGKIQMLSGAAADQASDLGRDAWKQIGDVPLLKPELPWEQACIEAPTVCLRGDKLVMFYAGAYNNAPQQIGAAMSSDGVTWTRLSPTPLLPNGHTGEWNSSESGHPGVFVDDDGQTYLFFQGNNDGGQTWWLSCRKIGWNGDVPAVQAP